MEALLTLNPLALLRALPGNFAQGIIWGIMALGLYISFRVLDFSDLTVDGSFATGGAVAVMLILAGWPAPLAALAAAVAGGLCGMVTGLLHTKLGIAPILAGILTQIALYSVNLHILGNKPNQAVSVDRYELLLSLREVNHSILFLLLLSAALIGLLYWFLGTELGCSIRATGCNSRMSAAQGIDTQKTKLLGLVLSNALVALSGALMAQYQGFVDVQMGRGAIVIGLAAIILGEVLHEPLAKHCGNFALRLLFVVLGGILYYLVLGLVIWLKLPTNDLKLFTAIIVAIFLAIPHLRGRRHAAAGRKAVQK